MNSSESLRAGRTAMRPASRWGAFRRSGVTVLLLAWRTDPVGPLARRSGAGAWIAGVFAGYWASFGLPSVGGFPLLWYWQRVASGQRRLRQTATAGPVKDVF